MDNNDKHDVFFGCFSMLMMHFIYSYMLHLLQKSPEKKIAKDPCLLFLHISVSVNATRNLPMKRLQVTVMRHLQAQLGQTLSLQSGSPTRRETETPKRPIVCGGKEYWLFNVVYFGQLSLEKILRKISETDLFTDSYYNKNGYFFNGFHLK